MPHRYTGWLACAGAEDGNVARPVFYFPNALISVHFRRHCKALSCNLAHTPTFLRGVGQSRTILGHACRNPRGEKA
jgi:hypothetical protein